MLMQETRAGRDILKCFPHHFAGGARDVRLYHGRRWESESERIGLCVLYRVGLYYVCFMYYDYYYYD